MTPGKREDPARAPFLWQKAQRFAASARSLTLDPAIVTAFSAAVSAIDAACVHCLGLRNASMHHAEAIHLLGKATLPPGIHQRAAKHFSVLLALRHMAAYTWEPSTAQDASRAIQAMDRLLDALQPLADAHDWG